jgi:hypothetical protein
MCFCKIFCTAFVICIFSTSYSHADFIDDDLGGEDVYFVNNLDYKFYEAKVEVVKYVDVKELDLPTRKFGDNPEVVLLRVIKSFVEDSLKHFVADYSEGERVAKDRFLYSDMISFFKTRVADYSGGKVAIIKKIYANGDFGASVVFVVTVGGKRDRFVLNNKAGRWFVSDLLLEDAKFQWLYMASDSDDEYIVYPINNDAE